MKVISLRIVSSFLFLLFVIQMHIVYADTCYGCKAPQINLTDIQHAQKRIQEQITEKNQSNTIIIASVLIVILGTFIASYSSFKRQYTKGGGEGMDLGPLPLDGGRTDPKVENKKRRLQIIGFGIIAFGSLLSLLTVKFAN